MKVLRIYDHMGDLKKEFNLYVEGEDFKWEASVPEVIWLGTISLEELGEAPVAERTPEAEAKPELILERLEEAVKLINIEEPEPEPEPEVKEKEIKDEPEKVHRKRSRVKGAKASSNVKSTEIIPQDNTRRADPTGNWFDRVA